MVSADKAIDPKYSYYLAWSREDNEFAVSFLELPGISGLGPTPADAFEQLKAALHGWVSVARQQQLPLPAPMHERPILIADLSNIRGVNLTSVVADLFPLESTHEQPIGNAEASSARSAELQMHGPV